MGRLNDAFAVLNGKVFKTEEGSTEAVNWFKEEFRLSISDLSELFDLSTHQVKRRTSGMRKRLVAKGLIPSDEFGNWQANSGFQGGAMPRYVQVKEEFREAKANQVDNKEAREVLKSDLFMDRLLAKLAEVMPSERQMAYLKTPLAGKRLEPSGNYERQIIAVQSDSHFYLTNSEYNAQIAQEANDTYFRRIFELATEAKNNADRVNKLHLFLLGDVFHGTSNYPDQRWDVDRTDIDQAEAFARVTIRNITLCLENFEEVEVSFAMGNHGKTGHNSTAPAHQNWEQVCYRFIMFAFTGNDRVKFNFTNEWYQLIDVMGHKWFLTHGDFMKGAGSFDTIASNFRKQIDLTHNWQYGIVGHFHRIGSCPLPKNPHNGKSRHLFVNGTYSLGDTFIAKFGAFHTNEQWAFTVDRSGIVAEHKVSLYS